jgi:hypothetical protein
MDYAQHYIPEVDPARFAEGVLALERNWDGPADTNGSIAATSDYWAALENDSAALRDNWRFQMNLFRARYDDYQRGREMREEEIQREIEEAIKSSDKEKGSAEIVEFARKNFSIHHDLDELTQLAQHLFELIQLQTSVEKYHASEPERGAVMDFVNFPLNDRLYYEFRFKQILELPNEADRVAALRELATWEDPGPGGFYDDIGDVSRSPHVISGEEFWTDPTFRRHSIPSFSWSNNGDDHRRLAWTDGQDILGMRYEGLAEADYEVVVSAWERVGALRANGKACEALPDPPIPAMPPVTGKFGGTIVMQAWSVPSELIENGALELRFESTSATGRAYRPELTEIWLKRRNP